MSEKRCLIGVLTLSDKGAQNVREDTSGPLLAELVGRLGDVVCKELLPDEQSRIEALLVDWCDNRRLDLVVTTGGTGLAPRDRTPEATRAVIEREVPGIAEAMRIQNLQKTPRAMLSRGIAGLRGKTLIINLPGSPRALQENLEVVLPALEHALQTANGSAYECASDSSKTAG